MHWVILAAVIFLVLVLISRQPKLGIPVGVVLLVGGATVVYLGQGEVERGRNLIPPEHVELSFVEYQPGYGSSWTFSARVANASDHTLLALNLRSTLYDCVAAPGSDAGSQAESCHVIGESSGQVDLHVPPGQSRDIRRTVNVGHVRPRGRAQWETVIEETAAR